MLENEENMAMNDAPIQVGKSVQLNPIGKVKDYISRMTASKEQIVNQKIQEHQNNSFNKTLSLYSHGASTDNQDLRKTYNKEGRMEEAAGMISAFNGSTGTAVDVISNFIDEHNEDDDDIYNAFYEFIQDGSIDAEQLSQRTIDRVAGYRPDESIVPTATIGEVEKDRIEEPALKDRWGNEYSAPYRDDEGTFIGDALGAAGGFVQNVGGLIESWLDKGLNKIGLMSDEALEKSEQLRDTARVENYIPGINENDFTYDAFQFLDEMAAWIGMEALTGGGSTEAFLARLGKLSPKVKSFIGLATKAMKSKWGKLAERGVKGAKDMFILNTLEGEDTQLSDMGWGALFNILLGGKFNKNFADKFTLKGIMNSSGAKKVLSGLKEVGIDIKPEAIGEFINKRFQGTKEQIEKQARAWAKNAEKLVDALLGTSTNRYSSETTTNVLKLIAEDLEKKISAAGDKVEDGILREASAKIRGLIKEDGMYTLSEIKNALRELAKSDINPFAKDVFGQPKNQGEVTKKLADWYRELKQGIEKWASEEGLGDIANLNKEIYVSNAIADGIGVKDIAEQISSKMGIPSLGLGALGGVITTAATNSPTKGAIVGSLLSLGKKARKTLLKSTNFRTNLSQLIYKLEGEEKAALADWVASEGKTKLESAGSKVLEELLNAADKSWWDAVMPDVLNVLKRDVGTQAIQEIVD